MLRITQIIADGSPGGGTTHVLQLLKGLSDRYRFAVITEPNSYLASEVEELGISCFQINMFGTLQILRAWRYIRGAVRGSKPDLIHAHGSRAGFITAISRPKSPFLYTSHGLHMLHRRGMLRELGFAAERYTNRRSTQTIFVSNADLKTARAHNFVSGLASPTMIYNGVEIDQLPESTPASPRQVGFVGRLEEPKDPFLFLDVVEQLPGYTATIVGGGSLETKIQTEIDQRKIENVQMSGVLDHADVITAMSKFGTIVITSKWEAFGMVAVEAMALGVPVVAVRVGGMEEVIESNESGLLIENRSPEDISDAVKRLDEDKQLRERIIEGGKRRVRRMFNVQRMVNEIDSVYNSSLMRS